ncbi:Phosphatidylglycerol--prolipoprotein diacylglyceryl transferase [Buchnera aphidicola (Eriosoma lanigerum)]|uniref:prolipoprotein diacylglyceryl transferase n=1 Tax=Buchnera aphidicola TaxID=9 RepID=UPI003463FB58
MNKYSILLPNFNPIAYSCEMFSIHWYGLLYLIGFYFSIWYGKNFAKKTKQKWLKKEIINITYISFVSIIIGGRLGYIIFYNFPYYSKNILSCFKIWEGGMSFHGGLIGIIVMILIYSKKNKKKFLEITDFIVPLVPFSLGLGRLGNLINGELWGKISINYPIYILFPAAKKIDFAASQQNIQLKLIFDKFGNLPRHPSQIYEFIFEGLLLFILFHYLKYTNQKTGIISGLFLICYAIIRIILELFREPDINIGYFLNCITMGQILSIPMLIIGITILIYAKIK